MKNDAPKKVTYTIVVTTKTEYMDELVNMMVIGSLHGISNFLESRNYKNSTVECINVEREEL